MERYNRRLFTCAVVVILILMGTAAFLPFRYAAERTENKLITLLESWRDGIYKETRQFATEVEALDTIPIESMLLDLPEREHKLKLRLEAIQTSVEEAERWIKTGLPGFDPQAFLVNGKLPNRTIGDFVFIEDQPYLIALQPDYDADWLNSYRLVLGPSIAKRFSSLAGKEWSLTLLLNSKVLFSTTSKLPAGTTLVDPQTSALLETIKNNEVSVAARIGLLGSKHCVLSVHKDFDQWDAIGEFVLVREKEPVYESFGATALAIACVILAGGAFAVVGFLQLPRRGRTGGKFSATSLFSAISISAALLLILASWFSAEVNSTAQRTYEMFVSESQVQVETAGSFFNSLDMIAFMALIVGVFAVALLFLGIVRKFQHYTAMRRSVAAAGFIAPAAIHLAIFTIGPILFALFISFQKWEILNPIKEFVGLSNYIELFNDPLLWTSLLNTLVYSLHVPITMAIALSLALALHQKIRGVTILRTLFFLPYITSFVAISTVWQWLYNPEFGLLNYLLSLVGISPITWLSDPATAMISVMLMSVWIQLGYQMVIFIAGLQGIPQHLYEAATIDGAGPWVRFRKITLPLLGPTIFFILVTSIINSFQVFTYIYVMTQGGPLHSTEVLVYHIYKNAWEYYRMGYASAIAWVLFILIMAVTIIQFTYFKKRIDAVTA